MSSKSRSITNERFETSLDLKSYSAELVDKMWFSLKKEKDVTIEDAQNQYTQRWHFSRQVEFFGPHTQCSGPAEDCRKTCPKL